MYLFTTATERNIRNVSNWVVVVIKKGVNTLGSITEPTLEGLEALETNKKLLIYPTLTNVHRKRRIHKYQNVLSISPYWKKNMDVRII